MNETIIYLWLNNQPEKNIYLSIYPPTPHPSLSLSPLLVLFLPLVLIQGGEGEEGTETRGEVV